MSDFDVQFNEQHFDVDFDGDQTFDVDFESGDKVGIPTKLSELLNDVGYITIDDVPPIPSKTSDLRNDSGFITEDDIPPLVNDLGNIDPSEYEDDREVFLNTLLDDGAYRFVWEDGDDYEYYVVVETMLDSGYVYQKYWYSEEGSYKPAADVLLDRGWYAPAGVSGAVLVERLLGGYAPIVSAENAPALTNAVVAEDGETKLSMAHKILKAINWRIRLYGDGLISIVPQATQAEGAEQAGRTLTCHRISAQQTWRYSA